MEHEFWLSRWQHNEIGFHEALHHTMLAEHWHSLELANDPRVFVPLCGKSVDMHWLRQRGCEIVGNELSAIAVEDFFADLAVVPAIAAAGDHRVLSGSGYTIIEGDFFTLSDAAVGTFDAVYDRAALIALPPTMRRDYAAKFRALCSPGVRVLLITLDYQNEAIKGPPFAVTCAEVERLFGGWCDIDVLATGPTQVKGHAVAQTAIRMIVK